MADVAWVLDPGRRVVLWLLLAYGPMLAWLCWPLTGLGGWSTPGIELFVLLPLIGLFQILFAAPLLLFRRSRNGARRWLLRGIVLFVGFLPFLWLGRAARMHAFRRAGERAAPLVAAIERHVAETGSAPASVAGLVPRWLPELPPRVPPLAIVCPGYEDNPWMLRASVPSGVINFDEFVYSSKQNYPERGWGGSLRRLGRWVYLHE